ncbi:MAG: 30S ribosomal protein S2 [Fibrobacter sp.]|nr:30S ribosomal protein S2 [Fibrobacter sp.]
MSTLSLQDLLEAGTHFGHQTKRWNPKMKRFILCPKNGIYIIDLNKTLFSIEKFIAQVRKEVARGGKVLFVGTKKQLKDCIREEAERCKMPYVSERWLGGMLTNFATIRQSVSKLEKIEAMEADGTIEALPKKERGLLAKRKEKLIDVLSGVRDMRKLPSIIFVVDTIKEHIAISEGRRLRIPIGAIVDTNCDPDAVDFPIPGNDDAIKSVQLIARAVSDAIIEESANITPEMIEKETANAEAILQAKKDLEIDELEESEDTKKKHRVVHKKIVRHVEEE